MTDRPALPSSAAAERFGREMLRAVSRLVLGRMLRLEEDEPDPAVRWRRLRDALALIGKRS